jgi:hypothetical protein
MEHSSCTTSLGVVDDDKLFVDDVSSFDPADVKLVLKI